MMDMQTMQKKDAYAIVMAGGRGERFWPQSRLSHPKQLLRLLGNLTLIEQTVERLLPVFEPDHIIVITNSDYVAPMQSLMSNIPSKNIIGEPLCKDTAPCIAFASAYVKSIAETENPTLCILPADHIINDVEAFDQVVTDAASVAASTDRIVTIGITPTFASTGYGYIELAEPIDFKLNTEFYDTCAFREKPDLATAEEYLRDGVHCWNGGMFFLSLSTFLDACDQHAPDLVKFFQSILSVYRGSSTQTLTDVYRTARKVSIDYAIMEKVKNIAVAKATFDWDDVGSWSSMRNQIRPGKNNNVVRGLHMGIDTKDCIIVGSPKHLIATIDVKDLVVVHTDDATLVCSAKSAQRVKELVHLLSEKPEFDSFL